MCYEIINGPVGFAYWVIAIWLIKPNISGQLEEEDFLAYQAEAEASEEAKPEDPAPWSLWLYRSCISFWEFLVGSDVHQTWVIVYVLYNNFVDNVNGYISLLGDWQVVESIVYGLVNVVVICVRKAW